MPNISIFIPLFTSNTQAHEIHLKASFVHKTVWIRCLPSESHTLLLRQHFLKVPALSHKYQSPFSKPFCSSWLLHCAESQHGWCVCSVKYIYVFIRYLSSFFSFFTVLHPLSSITDVVFSYTRSPLSPLKVSSFAHLSSSAIFFPFSLLFVCPSCWCWFIQEQGKSPLLIFIRTSYTVSQSLRSPALLMFPPLISGQPWSTLPWPHTWQRTGSWVSRAEKCKRAKKGEPRTFFCKGELCESARTLVFRPSFSLAFYLFSQPVPIVVLMRCRECCYQACPATLAM